MKKLSKINLHNLSQAELSKREENLLRGGSSSCICSCGTYCGCLYEGKKEDDYDSYYGGSTSYNNGQANVEKAFSATSNEQVDYAGG